MTDGVRIAILEGQKRSLEELLATVEDSFLEGARKLEKANADLARLDRLHAVLAQVNQTLVRAPSLDEFLDEICKHAETCGGFTLAWVCWYEWREDDARAVVRAGSARPEQSDLLEASEDGDPDGNPLSRCLSEDATVVLSETETAHWRSRWRLPPSVELSSCAVASFRVAGQVRGALVLGARESDFFRAPEVALLEEICMDVSFGLGHLEEERLRTSAEAALREERDLAALYLRMAGTMIVALGADGRVLLINDKGCEVLGWQRAELVGRDWFDAVIPEHARAAVREVFGYHVGGYANAPEYFESTVRRKDGEERLIAWHNTVIKDQDGRFWMTLSSGEDVTERLQVEAELAEARRLDSVGRLAASIAREISAPAQSLADQTAFLKESFTTLISLLERYRSGGSALGGAGTDPVRVQEVEKAEADAGLDHLITEIPKAVDRSLQEIQRVSRIVRAMEYMSRPDVPEPEQGDIRPALGPTSSG